MGECNLTGKGGGSGGAFQMGTVSQSGEVVLGWKPQFVLLARKDDWNYPGLITSTESQYVTFNSNADYFVKAALTQQGFIVDFGFRIKSIVYIAFR